MLHLRRGLRDSRLRGCPLSLPSARENHPPKGHNQDRLDGARGVRNRCDCKERAGCLVAWCLVLAFEFKGGVRKILIMTVLDYWVSPVEWVPVQYSVSTE